MKTQIIIRLTCLFFLMTGWIAAQGQNQIEVPGDNFSLEGALELFKKSASPEEFERMLNDPDSRVNNLDLNGDGYIDYMRVYDINEGNVHAFVIQAVISDRESQDVAVITLEKLANGKAVLQITGDEDIYGIETIIEPTQEVRTYAGTTSSRVVVNVWAWPSVRYIYGPYYSAWVSPWGWGYRPHWYHPWRPVVYYDYYSYWRPYYSYYSPCYTHRVVFAHRIYRSYRTTSVIVHERHYRQITHYRSSRIDNKGYYRENSSRSGSRQVSSAARYNANGRLSSSSSQTANTRSSSANRIEPRGTYSRNSSSENAARSRSYNQSSSNDRLSTSGNAQRSRERVSGNTGNSPTNGRISGNSSVQRSADNSSGQRSAGYSNSRQSSDNSTIKRSTSRSSGSSSSINRASGSSNSRQSSGNSSVQRSSGRSSSGANVQRSGGNSNSRQSSGSSSVQRSSGRSTGNANVQRSSGNSGTSRSSGNSSSRQSSNSNSRGRH